MKHLFYPTQRLLRITKRAFTILLVLFSISALCLLSSCKKEISYFDYVSELRSNYLVADNGTFYLRIYAVEREYPYAMDGVRHESSTRAEFHLVAPSGDQTCSVQFSMDGQPYGGEMSYDVVKAEYYYSCALDISALSALDIVINYGDTAVSLSAKTVKTPDTLTPQAALQRVYEANGELFTNLTDKYGFTGEICIRLIFEENPYYYIGVIDREGNITAFLLNAESGKILAKRQSK